MKSKEKKDKENHDKDPAEWTELKDFIQKKKTQNKALKKIIDKINDHDPAKK